jgi:predicted transglutaminase-like cysteine proteinase
MFGRIAARAVAMLIVWSPFIFGDPSTALAQYQVDVSSLAPVELLAPAGPSSQAAIVSEPFGLAVEPVTYGQVLNKWNGLVAEIGADRDILARCRDDAAACPPAAQKFLAVVATGRTHDGRSRIGTINRAVNMAIRPVSDAAQWGVPDRWSAPLATFASGRGDCEDYAIAKYVALREAGLAESDVRLVIVRDLNSGDDHAVVAAHVDDKWIVLDNRRLTLIEAGDMPRVRPLFVLDRDGVKRFTPPTAEARDAPASGQNTTAAPSALGF